MKNMNKKHSYLSKIDILMWIIFFNPAISFVFTLFFAVMWQITHNSGNPDTDMSVCGGYEWIVITPIIGYLTGTGMLFFIMKRIYLMSISQKIWRSLLFFTLSVCVYFLICLLLNAVS